MKLFHVSENPGIAVFTPKPSPQNYDIIKGNAVFAINEEMLHNYLLPRDCPRVTFYAGENSSNNDVKIFMGTSKCKYHIYTEVDWLEKIKNTTLYLYEFPDTDFELLDDNAGYYVSYNEVKPVNKITIHDPLNEFKKRNAVLMLSNDLRKLAEEVSNSSLQFSIIRLRYAKHN